MNLPDEPWVANVRVTPSELTVLCAWRLLAIIVQAEPVLRTTLIEGCLDGVLPCKTPLATWRIEEALLFLTTTELVQLDKHGDYVSREKGRNLASRLRISRDL